MPEYNKDVGPHSNSWEAWRGIDGETLDSELMASAEAFHLRRRGQFRLVDSVEVIIDIEH